MGYMENTAYFENGNWLEKTNISKHVFAFSKPFPFDSDVRGTIFKYLLWTPRNGNTYGS